MCGIDPVTATIGSAILGAVVSGVQGSRQARSADRANEQATRNAQATATQAEQDMNRRNAKTPNTAAMAASNQQAAQSGVGSTMLTGPAGVDPNSLSLGKNDLLGQ